jgi:hypothetical protein
MKISCVSRSDQQVENGECLGFRIVLLLAALPLASSCVDLTPPQSVVDYRAGRANGGAAGVTVSGTGGLEGGGGSAAAGGNGSGGSVLVASGGAAGASSFPPTSLGVGGSSIDAPSPTAGTSGGPDSAASATGGASKDAPDAGPEIGDVPMATGGAGGSGGGQGTGGTVGTGGVVGSGGAATGGSGSGGATGAGGASATGGTTSYNCASATVPPNGAITDFTNWDATAGLWRTDGFSGNIYRYGSSSATTTAKVEGTPAGLHVSGSIPSGGYGGGGLTFLSCLNVTSFTKIAFDAYGSAAGCSIELQLQTYDQRPAEQTPPGACKSDGGSSCYRFPAKSQIVSPSNLVAAPGKTVTETLSNFTNWSATAGGQIVGMQWQFSPSGGTCTPDVTFTNIKFLP